jgi:peroxiredoxin
MIRLVLPVLALGLLACSGSPEAEQPANEAALRASAEAADSIGLSVGSVAPPIVLSDVNGDVVSLADLAGENGTVIYFNRSVDWCPYCQVQVMELDTFSRQFANRGYGLAVITNDSQEILHAFAERRSVSIPLLSDPDSSLVSAFDIRDPVYTDPDHYAFGVPYPITFVIDPDGNITHKLWHEPGFGEMRGYRERISVRDVLSVLDAD